MRNNREKLLAKIILTFAVLAGIISIILFLLNGNTTTKTSDIKTIKNTSLRCSSNTVKYPFATYDNSLKKELKIDLIFNENILKTIALSYSLYYDNEEAVAISETQNHAAINIKFQNEGLGPDALNAKYTKLNDNFRLNLYHNGEKIDPVSAKYFLIKNDGGNLLETLSEYKTNYEQQNLICETSEQN